MKTSWSTFRPPSLDSATATSIDQSSDINPSAVNLAGSEEQYTTHVEVLLLYYRAGPQPPHLSRYGCHSLPTKRGENKEKGPSLGTGVTLVGQIPSSLITITGKYHVSSILSTMSVFVDRSPSFGGIYLRWVSCVWKPKGAYDPTRK